MSLIHTFLSQYPKDKNVFVMMKYGHDMKNHYDQLVEHNIERAFRSNKFYHGVFAKELSNMPNCKNLGEAVKVGIDSSSRGIAVFTYDEYGKINPNVAFELGIMWAQDKDILILKDSRIDNLFVDIIDKPYIEFLGTEEALSTDTNDLFWHCRRKLESWEKEDTDIFGMTYLQSVEINIYTDPKKAIGLMLSEIDKSFNAIVDSANNELSAKRQLTFRKLESPKKKVVYLLQKKQLTVFFAEVTLKVLKLCELFQEKDVLDNQEAAEFVKLSKILSDIHNSWVRNYHQFITVKYSNKKKQAEA